MVKEFSTSYLSDYREPNIEFDIIAGVNAPKIQASTGINGYSVIDTVQNDTLDDHESRLDSLESA